MSRILLILALLTCAGVALLVVRQTTSSQEPKRVVAIEPTAEEQIKNLLRRTTEAENKVQSLQIEMAQLKAQMVKANKEAENRILLIQTETAHLVKTEGDHWRTELKSLREWGRTPVGFRRREEARRKLRGRTRADFPWRT